jgi:hypothetical protein
MRWWYCHVSGYPWLIIKGSALDDWIYCHFFTITINYNSSQSVTACDSLHSLLDYDCLLFHSDWLGSDLRIGHIFRFRCPLVNTPQLNTPLLNCLRNSVTNEWLMPNDDSLRRNWTLLWINSRIRVRVRVTLWLTVYRQSFRLGDKPLETHDQYFFSNWTLAVIVLM